MKAKTLDHILHGLTNICKRFFRNIEILRRSILLNLYLHKPTALCDVKLVCSNNKTIFYKTILMHKLDGRRPKKKLDTISMRLSIHSYLPFFAVSVVFARTFLLKFSLAYQLWLLQFLYPEVYVLPSYNQRSIYQLATCWLKVPSDCSESAIWDFILYFLQTSSGRSGAVYEHWGKQVSVSMSFAVGCFIRIFQILMLMVLTISNLVVICIGCADRILDGYLKSVIKSYVTCWSWLEIWS